MEVSIISPSSSSTTSGAASPRPELDVAASLPLLGLVLPPNPLLLSPPPSPLCILFGYVKNLLPC